MPKESFWNPTALEGDDPDLSVSWGETPVPQVVIDMRGGELKTDRSGLNRLIGSLRKARNQVYGPDE
jgi:hypothetical protein